MCQFLNVPTLPIFSYLSRAIIDCSFFASTVRTIALAEFAAMVALSSVKKAYEGVMWLTRYNDPTFPAQSLYPVFRVFHMCKQLVQIVRDEHGVENLVRDRPYSVDELTVILMTLRTIPEGQVRPGRYGTITNSRSYQGITEPSRSSCQSRRWAG